MELRKQEWSDKSTNKMQAIEFLEKSAEEALHSIIYMLDSNKLDSSAKEFSVRYYGNSLEFMFHQAWNVNVITDVMYDDFRKKFNEIRYSDKALKADVWKQMKKEVISALNEKTNVAKEKKAKKKAKIR